MALMFSQLVSPLSQSSWLQYLLTSLQGVGPVIQAPTTNTNQLSGTGSVTVQGPAQAAAQVVILITTSGNAAGSGAAAFQYSIDGGLTYNPPSPVSMSTLGSGYSYVIPGVNLEIIFANGAYTTASSGGNSFVSGETYSFDTTTPTFPVTNWTPIGVGNALLQVDAQALSDLNLLVAQAIAGGFTESWINPPLVNGVPTPPPDGWLDLLAQSFYNRQRGAALQTQGLAVLAAVTSAGPYTIIPGQLFAASANGQFIFTNITGGTLSQGGNLSLTFQAQLPGSAYNQVASFDAPGSSSGFWLTSLLTPLAGVSISNPMQDNPVVTHSGVGTGSITASSSGPTGEYNVLIKILQPGGLGVGTFQWSSNSGVSYSAPTTIPGSGNFTIGSTNVSVTFSGTFTEGDLYAFTTSWITQRGVDSQTSLSLAVACQSQWSTLAASGATPAGQYLLWAQQASPEVVNALVIADPVTPGQVDVTLIGANNGPVSSTAITSVQTYIKARIGLCLGVNVGTVSTLAVLTEAAYIVVHSAYRNTVQNAIQSLFNTYASSILPQGTVALSEIAELIQQAPGVIEIDPLSSLEMNPGGAGYSAADVVLTANQTAQIAAPTSGSFKFV
jgi:hypothetical protein